MDWVEGVLFSMVFSKVINVKCVPVYNRRVLRIQPYAFQKTSDCIRVENSFVTDMSDMHVWICQDADMYSTVDERGIYNMHDLRRLNVKYQLTVHDLIWVGQEYACIIYARADESTERNRLDHYSTCYATSVPLNCAHHFMADSRLVNKHPYI